MLQVLFSDLLPLWSQAYTVGKVATNVGEIEQRDKVRANDDLHGKMAAANFGPIASEFVNASGMGINSFPQS